MAMLSGYLPITLSVSLLALGTACATVRNAPPEERPAEIVLPPTFANGGFDKIKSDLEAFTPGDTHQHTRPATCKKCVVEVDIHSIGLTRDIRPLDRPKKFRIVAWLKNKDKDHTEAEYSLKPLTEYLMWIDSAPLNKAGTSRIIWGLLELPAASTGAIKLDTIGYVKQCLHPQPPGLMKSDADFKNCEDAHLARRPLRPQRSAMVAALFASSERMEISGPAWFDCGGYCCTGTTEMF